MIIQGAKKTVFEHKHLTEVTLSAKKHEYSLLKKKLNIKPTEYKIRKDLQKALILIGLSG